MIRLMIDNKQYRINWITFSDGAISCKILDCPEYFGNAWITVDPTTPVKDIVMEVLLVKNALDINNGNVNWFSGLNIPYLPFGRADRKFERGNPIPLGVFLDVVSPHFEEIQTIDAHNEDVVKHYLKNTPQHLVVKQTIRDLGSYDYVVAPDKGALKKIYELGVPVITASKVRDITSGYIIETTLDTQVDLNGCKLLIVDDILDGGGTFIPLACKLKSMGASVDLYVTHLIAAKGLDIFKGKIDNIHCYHTVSNYINMIDVLNYNKGV